MKELAKFESVSLEELQTLKEKLVLKEKPICLWKACKEDGVYFMRRVMYNGSVQKGMYCPEHEERIGTDNVRKWVKG